MTNQETEKYQNATVKKQDPVKTPTPDAIYINLSADEYEKLLKEKEMYRKLWQETEEELTVLEKAQTRSPLDDCIQCDPHLDEPTPTNPTPNPVEKEKNTDWWVIAFFTIICLLVIYAAYKLRPAAEQISINLDPVITKLDSIGRDIKYLVGKDFNIPVEPPSTPITHQAEIKKLKGANRWLRKLEKKHRLTINKLKKSSTLSADQLLAQRKYFFDEWLKAAKENDNKEWILCFSDQSEGCNVYNKKIGLFRR